MNYSNEIFKRVNSGEKMIPVKDASMLRTINRITIWKWAKSGDIPSVRIGNRYYTVDSVVTEYLVRKNSTPKDSAQC